MVSRPISCFKWSELSQHDVVIGVAIDDLGEVVLVRSWHLLRFAQPMSPDTIQVLHDVSGLLAVCAEVSTSERVLQVLVALWPWAAALSAGDQLDLVADVGRLAVWCEVSGSVRALLNLVADYRCSARALVDGCVPHTQV